MVALHWFPALQSPLNSRLSVGTGPIGCLARWRGTLRIWSRRRRYRRELRRLLMVAPHMIDDIGLTMTDAVEEARKPVWEA